MSAMKNPAKRICALLLCLCLLLTLTGCTTEGKYQSANKLLAEGKYAEAAEKFEALGSFEDAPMLTMYAKAAAAGESGQFEACLQAFETLGDFKDSPLMVAYYTARAYEAQGLAAETPQQQAELESWESLLTAAEIYGQQLLFRDSQQRQQDCYQAVYDMAEGLADTELFWYASDAHAGLAYYGYKDSSDLSQYYLARYYEADGPKQVVFGERWVVLDFGQYAKAAEIYDQIFLLRDSQSRADNCRKTLYDSAAIYAANGDYASAATIAGYATIYKDASNLSKYYTACDYEQQEQYAAAATAFEALGDYAPEGGDTGAVRAEAARQNGYNAAMALLEEGKYDDGYALLRSLGDFGGATAYVPQHQFQRAQAHLDAGEYEDALSLFELISLLADDGGVPEYTPELGEAAEGKMQESFYRYGEALFADAKTEEDYKEARQMFLDAGEYTPEGGVPAEKRYYSLWYERGEAYLSEEKPDYEKAWFSYMQAGDMRMLQT